MLTLELSDFMLELKDGTVKHVGPSNKTGEAKLFDVEAIEARAFGDRRVKVVAEDEAGSEVQIALDPDDARALADDIDALEEDSPVFE